MRDIHPKSKNFYQSPNLELGEKHVEARVGPSDPTGHIPLVLKPMPQRNRGNLSTCQLS